MELLGAIAFLGGVVWFSVVWRECRELREDNAELKRELTRAIAQRDPWIDEESVVHLKAA